MDTNISIILPTYNGASRIRRAIESVIAQSYTDWELLVIDDGSTDATGEVVEAFVLRDARIRYTKNEHNLGIQKTLNRGLHIAQGGYIARIDDDDIWSDAGKLQKQVEFLSSHPDHVLVGTGVIVVDEAGSEMLRYRLPQTDSAIRAKILSKNCFVHSSVLFVKRAALQFGGYSQSSTTLHIEDYDLWLKLGVIGKFANISEYAVTFTLREGGLSSQHKKEQFEKNRALIEKYRRMYPGYTTARFWSWVRVHIYGFLMRRPLRNVVTPLLRFYKENW